MFLKRSKYVKMVNETNFGQIIICHPELGNSTETWIPEPLYFYIAKRWPGMKPHKGIHIFLAKDGPVYICPDCTYYLHVKETGASVMT